MKDVTHPHTPPASWAPVFVAIWGLGAAWTLGALLVQLNWHGWAHSFDGPIYVRSLWGFANGHTWNPIVDLQSLSIHSNVMLVLLAPFTWLLPATTVLLLAQAFSYGGIMAVTAGHVLRDAAIRGEDAVAQIGWMGFASILMISTPLVTNPFLFDLRPDMIGVILLGGGMVRARMVGNYDKRAVGLLLASLLVREENAAVIVMAVLTTPASLPAIRETWRLRAVTAAIAVGWLLLYWYVVRPAMGDGSYDIAHSVAADFVDEGESLTMWQVVGYKAEILMVTVLAAGGLSLLGWRWFLPVLPGLALALATSRMQSLVLNFHYLVFCAPAVLVSAIDGAARLGEMVKKRPERGMTLVTLVALCGVLVYFTSSALPGGGRFRGENFLLLNELPAEGEVSAGEQVQALHDLASRIPEGESVVMPFAIAARFGEREHIRVWEKVEQGLAAGQPFPSEAQWVVVPGRNWRNVGAWLVQERNYGLVGFAGRQAALLGQGIEALPLDELTQVYGTVRCEVPLAEWPAWGIDLCAVQPQPGNILALWIRGSIASRAPANAMLVVRAAGGDRQGGVPAMIHSGLVRINEIRQTPLPAITAGALDGQQWEIELRVPDRVEVALLPDGSSVQQVIIGLPGAAP